MVVQDEVATVVGYYVDEENRDRHRSSPGVVDGETEPVALARFHGAYATMFGPPNDEALSGHPLPVVD